MQVSTAPIVSRLADHEGRVEPSSPAVADLQKLHGAISAAGRATHAGDPDLAGVQEHIDVLLAVAMRSDDLGRSAQGHLRSIFQGAGAPLQQRLANSAYHLCVYTLKEPLRLEDKPIPAMVADLALLAKPPVSGAGELSLLEEYLNALVDMAPADGGNPLRSSRRKTRRSKTPTQPP